MTAAVSVGLALVAVEQHRPAQPHLAVGADLDLDPVERAAVVHAAAAGLAHAVGRHDPDPAPPRRAPRSAGVERAAADAAPRRSRRAPRRRRRRAAGRAGSAPARRSAAPGHRRDRVGERAVLDDRLGARDAPSGRAPARPATYDGGRFSSHWPGPAEPGLRGVGGGAHRVPGEHAPASAARSSPRSRSPAAPGSSAASHSRSSARISLGGAATTGAQAAHDRQTVCLRRIPHCDNPGHPRPVDRGRAPAHPARRRLPRAGRDRRRGVGTTRPSGGRRCSRWSSRCRCRSG